MPPKKKGIKKNGKHPSFPQKAHDFAIFWRIFAVSRECGRPGTTADAASNKVC
jgi:hypothetical protein